MSDAKPILRYRTQEPTEAEKRAAHSPVEQVWSGLTWGILIICLSVWAVVGLIFWIPLLIRTMVRFSAALVPSVLASKRPEESARMLREAVGFYRRGFQVAIEVVTRSGEEEEHEHRGEEGSAIKRFNTLNELAWVVVIWYFILLIFGGIRTTPVDMWWWLVGVDWYGVFVQPIVEFLQGFTA